MKPNLIYMWEVQIANGAVFRRWNEDGTENSFRKSVTVPDDVVRVSMIPRIPVLPQHDVLLDIRKGERFIKWFGRGFQKQSAGFNLVEYVNCIVTNKYRLWVYSSGKTLVTRRDFELYI